MQFINLHCLTFAALKVRGSFVRSSMLPKLRASDFEPQTGRAGVAKLADASDLGSDAARHVGSIPITRTKEVQDVSKVRDVQKLRTQPLEQLELLKLIKLA
jgi:hypothetical protein